MTGAAEQAGRGAGLELAIAVWTRRKWVGIVAFAAAFAAAVSFAIWLPDLYRATATVLIDTQQVSEALVRPSTNSELPSRLQRIEQELTSRARLGSLIMRLDLYGTLRSRGVPIDAVIDAMRRDVNVSVQGADPAAGIRGPIALTISYIGRDPETVARVANVLASLYVEENNRMRTGQAVRTAEFLRSQLAAAKSELDAQELRASEFKLKHLGELPQQIEANLGSLERLNTQLRMNNETQIRAMDRRERLEGQLAAAGTTGTIGTPSAQAGALAKLKQELADLRRHFSDAYPDVVRVKAEIAALERQDAGTPRSAKADTPEADVRMRLTDALAQVERELAALKEDERGLRQAISAYEKRVDNVPKRQEEFLTLSRDYESTKARYEALRKRYEEAQLAENLEQDQNIEQFKILDAAIAPRGPSAPGRLRLIAAGLMFSLVFAIGVVFGAEKLDTSFHDIDDLRTIVRGAPLFSIPVIHAPVDTWRRWRRVALAATAVVIGLAVVVAGCRYLASGNERVARIVSRGHV